MGKLNTLVLLILGLSLTKANENPIVKLPDGKVQGRLSTSYNGRQYMEFAGIPYAEPPTGDLRFEEPKPIKSWNGIWMANMSTECIQVTHLPDPEGGLTIGTEDCLHMNVLIPGNKINANSKLDVIIHIHGGAFMFGSGYMYATPKYIMDRDVVFVTFNYRVGVLGFLSTGDKYLPGNLGMKDQSFALKWVKQNIKYFGGNPNSITITGLSAGGASVHYHYLSPLSKGLFNWGISTSGCALNSWTIQEEPLVKARIIGNAVGCSQKDTEKLVKCLKKRTAAQLNEAIRLLRPWLINPYSPLGIVVDDSSKTPFLPEHPYKLLVDGKVSNDVPWIISATTSEGLYPAAEFAVKEKHLKNLNENWQEYAPAILHYMETIPENLKEAVTDKIKNYYMGDKEINKESFSELIQLMSDRLFVADIELAAKLQAKVVKSPVYYYQYDYTPDQRDSLAYLFTHSKDIYGVCHGDDMMFVFSDDTEKLVRNDLVMKETLLGLWTSYAKTGKPNIDWTPVSKNFEDPINYLYIGPTVELEQRTAKELGHRSFWESLPFEENANLFNKQNVKTEL